MEESSIEHMRGHAGPQKGEDERLAGDGNHVKEVT